MSKVEFIRLICDNMHCEREVFKQTSPSVSGGRDLFSGWIKTNGPEGKVYDFCCSRCVSQFYEDEACGEGKSDSAIRRALKGKL